MSPEEKLQLISLIDKCNDSELNEISLYVDSLRMTKKRRIPDELMVTCHFDAGNDIVLDSRSQDPS
jgi:hypothetical protein